MLTKQQIQTQGDLEIERVDLPEWTPPGGDEEESFVYVRGLTNFEAEEIERLTRKHNSGQAVDVRAQIVIRGACDEHGVPLFAPSDVSWLTKKAAGPVGRIVAAIMKLTNVDGDIEPARKNSKTEPSDGSGSSPASPTESPSENSKHEPTPAIAPS